MSLYQTDYNAFVVEQLPPDKRITKEGDQNKMVNWLQANVATPMQYLNDLMFTDIATGANYSAYDAGTTYARGDKVQYKQSVYESYDDSNVGNTPDAPNSLYWFVRQDNYVGIDERIQYNCSCLVFTYALNKRFGGAFVQPPLISDIYILNNATAIQSFVASDGGNASAVSKTNSTGFVINDPFYTKNDDFTIYFPTAIYDAILGGDEEIRQFADKYNAAGLTYSIEAY
jgi:hypothetical protein